MKNITERFFDNAYLFLEAMGLSLVVIKTIKLQPAEND